LIYENVLFNGTVLKQCR